VAKEAAGKLQNWCETDEKHTSGAKARVDSAEFMYGLKLVPFIELSFSAASKALSYS